MKLVAAVLVTVLAVLLPLAHGSPIDPSAPGFWDDGDFDDVILFLTSGLHLLDTADRPLVCPSERVSTEVFQHPAGPVALRAYEPGTPRAPPASSVS